MRNWFYDEFVEGFVVWWSCEWKRGECVIKVEWNLWFIWINYGMVWRILVFGVWEVKYVDEVGIWCGLYVWVKG